MKVCLAVIDGWGESTETEGNAVRNAKTPTMDFLKKEGLATTIAAHGLAVGLPDGQMGNSEVGHLNIGAGRVVNQDIVRINNAIEQHTFEANPVLQNVLETPTNRLHLIGILSDGGVHGHIRHLMELLDCARRKGVGECYVHCFGDGRDTEPKKLKTYVACLQAHMHQNSYGVVSTVVGRYYAMDRDNRWDRVATALDCMIDGKGIHTDNIVEEITERYRAGETDEFLSPIVCVPNGCIAEGDTLIFFNYRADRMRQICSALCGQRDWKIPKNLRMASMTRYKDSFVFPVLFDQLDMVNGLAETVARAGLAQCHVAETEKYAHVTFFFNGRREEPFAGEERILVASPAVKTYDLQPEMKACEVARKVAETMQRGVSSLIICNLAPPDMVGHTGSYSAAVAAVEATDAAVEILYRNAMDCGYALVVTSDHGNAEKMLEKDGKMCKSHTTAAVPFVVAGVSGSLVQPAHRQAALCDVAPSVLALMALDCPAEMEGCSLVALS